jgi:hypothetical protein
MMPVERRTAHPCGKLKMENGMIMGALEQLKTPCVRKFSHAPKKP